MIVYCAGPIKGDKQYQPFYIEIVKHVTALGHTALSEMNEQFRSTIPLTDSQIFKRNIKWMEKSDIIIAEASSSSTGVGFEIAYVLYNLKKHVLVLNKEGAKTISAMINGCDSELMDVKHYSDSEDIKKIISIYINEFQNV
jgi:nucleoside 2-deoxyribosyltransferase